MQRIVDRRITPGKVAKYTAAAGVAVGSELYYAGVEVGKVFEPGTRIIGTRIPRSPPPHPRPRASRPRVSFRRVGVMRRSRRRRQNLAKIAITEAEEEDAARIDRGASSSPPGVAADPRHEIEQLAAWLLIEAALPSCVRGDNGKAFGQLWRRPARRQEARCQPSVLAAWIGQAPDRPVVDARAVQHQQQRQRLAA